MRISHTIFCLLCIVPVLSAEDSKAIEHFENKIRPVLVRHCYRCHSSKVPRPKGELLLDSRAGILKGGENGEIIVPRKPHQSPLILALQHKEGEMPPNKKLSEPIIDDFVRWVQMGAPIPTKTVSANSDSPLWALQPPSKQGIPKVKDDSWPANEIDHFVLNRLEEKVLHPNPDANAETWLRRVTFDLIGLPPTIDEMNAFLNDDSAEAKTKVVDRLLASPGFGQRWGRHWLDVARFGESAGQSRNISYRFAWRYRNWVIDAFNKDLPYDQFIIQQLAGDLLEADTQDQRDSQHIATGFLMVGPKLLNENNKSLVYRMGVVDDQIDTTFRAFMGLTIGCARCHDHKYDPIPTRDYYALAGIFRSTENLCGVESNNNTIDNGLYPLGKGGEKVLAEIDAKKKIFESLSKDLAKARRHQQSQEAKLRELMKKNAPMSEITKQQEIVNMAKATYRDVARRRNKARSAIPKPPPSAMAAREGKTIKDSEVFQSGDVGNPGKAVPRGMLSAFHKVCPPSKIGTRESGRLQLAHWIANRRNPLTARVMVNRIWHHLFGIGIVNTVDNFGSLGELPVHPELLDHLAVRLMDEGWSIKKMIRQIVLSRTYALSSNHNSRAYAADPDNRFLWRMSRRRLEGEAIRDAMLAVAGRLDTSHRQGSAVSEQGMFEMSPQHRVRLHTSYGVETCRSTYLPVMRAALPHALSLFDAPNPSLVVGKRAVTTVAPQALYLLNDEFVIENAKAVAAKVADTKGSDTDRIHFAYRLLLNREPNSAERERLLEYLRTEPNDWMSICHVLMASAEFRTLY